MRDCFGGHTGDFGTVLGSDIICQFLAEMERNQGTKKKQTMLFANELRKVTEYDLWILSEWLPK